MSSILNTLQLAGFTAAGTPANGTGLLGFSTINLWSDGAITFANAAGATKKIHDNPELNALLAMILTGASGVSTTKKFHT